MWAQVVGRNWNGLPDNPCRVKRIPSPIPARQWYLQPAVIALMGGLLPFGSIFIEMYFIFTSFWNYKARPSLLLSVTAPCLFLSERVVPWCSESVMEAMPGVSACPPSMRDFWYSSGELAVSLGVVGWLQQERQVYYNKS